MSAANVCGVPISFAFTDPKGGKVWELQVSVRTFEMEFAIQRRLEDRALEAVKRHRDSMTAQEYTLNMDGWRRDVATAVYEMGGESCWRFLTSKTGWVFNAVLQLKASSPEVDAALLERIYADADKMKELDEKMGILNNPNPRRAAAPEADRPQADSPCSTSSPASPASPT